VLSGLDSPERSKPWELQPGNVLVEKDGTAYENDACKRRTRKVESDGSVTRYSWDCRDRLRSVVLPDGRLVEFTYDAFARRVRKVVTDAPKLPLAEALREALKHGAAEQRVVTTRFLWDGDVLCAELGEAGARVHVHEPGSFVPLLQAEGGAVYSVVTDHLGMPKELLDASGKVAWAAAHSAWGRVLEVQRDDGAAEVESPFRLLGQYHDEETGLSYTRFRYFDAEAGRWCSPDPLGIAGGINLAGFDGAPSIIVDPLGLCPKSKKRLYRGMKETEEGPEIGPSARTLGARPDVDISVVNGQVEPDNGGISVSPDDPANLPPHRRPPALGGTGRDPVWEIDADDLGPHLRYDEDTPGKHGTIQPAYPMTLEEFQRRLAETQGRWRKVT